MNTHLKPISATLGVLAIAAILVLTGAVDQVSIITNPFVVISVLVSVALSAASVLRNDPGWYRTRLPIIVVVTSVSVLVLALVLHQTRTITDQYPVTFLLWVEWGVLAIAIAPFGVRGCTAWRIPIQVLAAVIVPFTAFTLINTHYAYWPTVGDLRGAPMTDQSAGLPPLSSTPPGKAKKNAGAANPDHGTLAEVDIPSTNSGFVHRQTYTYVPPAFSSAPIGSLPVIIMFSGTPGNSNGWVRAGQAAKTADEYAKNHKGLGPIIIFPDENGSATADTECLDGPAGNADTYLTVDLPAFVKDKLGFDLTPDQTALVGFSEGGTCTITLALRHPNFSHRIVNLGGAITPSLTPQSETLNGLFGGDQAAMDAANSFTLLAANDYPDLIAWFATGSSPKNLVNVQNKGVAAFRDARATVYDEVVPGIHNWEFASSQFARILPDLAKTIGLP